MRIRYNAPVTLTIALAASAVLGIDQLFGAHLISHYFTVPPRSQFNFSSPAEYLLLFSFVLGHAGWAHLIGNFSFILLLGPILEEKYGSLSLLFMILVTAFVTGLINVLFLNTGLLGASGIAFMMILLISFTNIRSGEIPITFILIILIYVVQQVIAAFKPDNISEMAHLIGGVFGSLFGFVRPARRLKE
ncbi:MAG TPA: rhomboid family intramembrane serine protease [Spirochaetia bacterium]|nr:rhomboid family intramembrane serine protease [Spirochaetia bacterium]